MIRDTKQLDSKFNKITLPSNIFHRFKEQIMRFCFSCYYTKIYTVIIKTVLAVRLLKLRKCLALHFANNQVFCYFKGF